MDGDFYIDHNGKWIPLSGPINLTEERTPPTFDEVRLEARREVYRKYGKRIRSSRKALRYLNRREG